jgi:cytochrome c oxidase subunit 4
MSSIKTYTALFGVLMVLSTTQFLIEQMGLVAEQGTYALGFGLIIGISSLKALGVAGYYMHLRDEPRAISYIALGGLICVLALTAGAGYSIL